MCNCMEIDTIKFQIDYRSMLQRKIIFFRKDLHKNIEEINISLVVFMYN